MVKPFYIYEKTLKNVHDKQAQKQYLIFSLRGFLPVEKRPPHLIKTKCKYKENNL